MDNLKLYQENKKLVTQLIKDSEDKIKYLEEFRKRKYPGCGGTEMAKRRTLHSIMELNVKIQSLIHDNFCKMMVNEFNSMHYKYQSLFKILIKCSMKIYKLLLEKDEKINDLPSL